MTTALASALDVAVWQGIPFFYRWLVERYPLCSLPVTHDATVPDIDNLFLDMNGIIHQATHFDGSTTGSGGGGVPRDV